MTDQDAHTPTDQETALYDALTAGDHEAIDDLREDAYTADQTPPASKPGDDADVGLTPAAQYDEDYAHAHAHYQADHEAPEVDRIENTADHVDDENLEARDG